MKWNLIRIVMERIRIHRKQEIVKMCKNLFFISAFLIEHNFVLSSGNYVILMVSMFLPRNLSKAFFTKP